mgnify:FL=1
MQLKVLILCLLCSQVVAHEMTPTYPKLEISQISNVFVAKLKLWNRRNDTLYYSVSVFDDQWKPIQFASTNRVMKVDYNKTKLFEVYIRSTDKNRVVYICTESKLFKVLDKVSLISSRICSKIKK